MNAADALSLLRAQAIENVNGDTADLATLSNSAAHLFVKYRAGSETLRPKQALLSSNFCMIRGKSICQFLYD